MQNKINKYTIKTPRGKLAFFGVITFYTSLILLIPTFADNEINHLFLTEGTVKNYLTKMILII